MNLSEAKQLFEKHHPGEATRIKDRKEAYKGMYPRQIELYFQMVANAMSVWHGFKSALKVTGQLEEE